MGGPDDRVLRGGKLITLPGAQNLRDDISNRLRWSILSGELTPGERLVETRLAKKWGVSRGPIREAIQLLQQQGLVVSRPHLGAYVAQINVEEMELLIQLRCFVEGFAAEKATFQVSRRDIASLRELVRTMVTAARQDEHDVLLEADVQFHEAILKLSGSDLLLHLWRSMDGPVRMRMNNDLHQPSRLSLEETAHDHLAIVDALESGDPEKARIAVVNHIRRALELKSSGEELRGPNK